jgi:hypothetical protein
VSSLLVLKEDNRRLFGEQVNDHIEKLNDLMGLSSGVAVTEQAIRRACLATRLLEGSTRMLGLDGWSGTLKSFRELLERSAGSGRCWGEQLSQIVSEVLETEEQIVAEIFAGELEELGRAARFQGLLKEIECLAVESGDPDPEDPPAVEAAPPHATRLVGTVDPSERVPTLTRLIDSITQMRDMLNEHIDRPSRASKSVRDLEVAFGESEFFMGLVAETLRRLGKTDRPFIAKISCSAVLEGLKDFFDTYLRLRQWNARLATRCAEFTLDRDIASALAAILDSCIFDICRRYEVRDELSLTIGVDIKSEGSFLVATIQDNGPDYLSDSQIDPEDTGAFYQCLREVRGKLESFGALLWLEPDGGSEGRFRFTLPRTRVKTDYHIVTACGKRIAVPCHAVDSVVGVDSVETGATSRRHVLMSGARVPVFALDELAADEFEPSREPERVLVVGLAEKRIGLLVEGQGRTVDTIADQVTEGGWGSIARSFLNLGEDEFPIIDVSEMLRAACSLHGTEGGPEEAGTYADGGHGRDQEVTVPRVQ